MLNNAIQMSWQLRELLSSLLPSFGAEWAQGPLFWFLWGSRFLLSEQHCLNQSVDSWVVQAFCVQRSVPSSSVPWWQATPCLLLFQCRSWCRHGSLLVRGGMVCFQESCCPLHVLLSFFEWLFSRQKHWKHEKENYSPLAFKTSARFYRSFD